MLRVTEQYWGGLGLRNAASYRTILGWVRIKECCELQCEEMLPRKLSGAV